MTAEEHELIACMFAKQLRYIELLIEILQSREVLKEKDDVAAFLYLLNSKQERNASALQSVKAEYLRLAEEIGLNVTFPKGD